MRQLFLNLVIILSLGSLTAEAAGRKFDDLSAKNKVLVRDTYRKLLSAHERKDFSEMQDDAREILSLLDDYNDTKSYQAIAERGLSAASTAAAKEASDDSALRERAEMEIRGQKLVEKAMTSADSRVELYKLMDELKKLDPNSTYPDEWKKKLHP